mmetsp:Transcript_104747/g.208114  ORF Transcript_104747/g.208114 Transcript_104747/m.208114 type:complete len:221 (-) Transcript_104747:158-820(-)
MPHWRQLRRLGTLLFLSQTSSERNGASLIAAAGTQRETSSTQVNWDEEFLKAGLFWEDDVQLYLRLVTNESLDDWQEIRSGGRIGINCKKDGCKNDIGDFKLNVGHETRVRNVMMANKQWNTAYLALPDREPPLVGHFKVWAFYWSAVYNDMFHTNPKTKGRSPEVAFNAIIKIGNDVRTSKGATVEWKNEGVWTADDIKKNSKLVFEFVIENNGAVRWL